MSAYRAQKSGVDMQNALCQKCHGSVKVDLSMVFQASSLKLRCLDIDDYGFIDHSNLPAPVDVGILLWKAPESTTRNMQSMSCTVMDLFPDDFKFCFSYLSSSKIGQ